MKTRISKLSAPIITASILIIGIFVLGVKAQSGETKGYPEGEGAQATGRTESETSGLKPGEGIAGTSGTAELDAVSEELTVEGMSVLYRFSGATDDGEQGSANRKEATSVHCTNIDNSNDAQVEVQIVQWNGTDVFTGTMSILPNHTVAFSTQNTTIYFEDVFIGGNPGTPAIFQGSGRILSSHANVICTAQVLDPLNHPPTFVSAVELFRQ